MAAIKAHRHLCVVSGETLHRALSLGFFFLFNRFKLAVLIPHTFPSRSTRLVLIIIIGNLTAPVLGLLGSFIDGPL
jgi:hypothetical protein